MSWVFEVWGCLASSLVSWINTVFWCLFAATGALNTLEDMPISPKGGCCLRKVAVLLVGKLTVVNRGNKPDLGNRALPTQPTMISCAQ